MNTITINRNSKWLCGLTCGSWHHTMKIFKDGVEVVAIYNWDSLQRERLSKTPLSLEERDWVEAEIKRELGNARHLPIPSSRTSDDWYRQNT